jgi:hypothetical protein
MKYLAILSLLALAACIPLRHSARVQLVELRDVGIGATEQAVTSPALAGALNILPGFGNFYLAASADEGGQWAVGFLNLLTWPWSVVWGIPQAAIDANTANKLATVDYYFHTKRGKAEMAERAKR